MPIDADNLAQIPPTVRREFDVTNPLSVDTLAFFVEHPGDAYHIDEIQQVTRACPDAYPTIPTSRNRKAEFQHRLKNCVKIGLLGAASGGHYYYLSKNEVAELLLDIAGWSDVRDIERITPSRGLDEVSFSGPTLSGT